MSNSQSSITGTDPPLTLFLFSRPSCLKEIQKEWTTESEERHAAEGRDKDLIQQPLQQGLVPLSVGYALNLINQWRSSISDLHL